MWAIALAFVEEGLSVGEKKNEPMQLIAPAGFWPRRPKPEEAPKRSPRIRDENFAVAEKSSIFQEQGSQRIAEKYARDCRNFTGGRIYK